MKEGHFSEVVRKLIDLLGKPEEGELNYERQKEEMSRLEALRELKRLEKRGIIPTPVNCGGVNTHVHTSESFSIFKSPVEAAWIGYQNGLEVLGINDHYTIDGHREFGEACAELGLKPIFGIEAMAMSENAKERGERWNDPKNPGRIYLCGKGVARNLQQGSESERLLLTMREAFRRRCREMTEKVDSILRWIDPSLRLSFDDVLRLTPRGNVTERHLAQAIAELINRNFPEEDNRKEFLKKFLGRFRDEEIRAEGTFQDLIRNGLLKVGGPAYIEEPPEAFPSLDKLVKLFRDYGSIPTYPVLGNPVTEKESNLDSLFDELEELGIFAVEVIPARNTRKRLEEILQVAERHGFPVFNGTEHNTKSPKPILDEFSKETRFQLVFRRGAHLILGHQFLSKYAGTGYIDHLGMLTMKDRKKSIVFFSFVGRITWQEKVLQRFSNVNHEDVFKMVFGVYTVIDEDGFSEWVAKSDFEMPTGLLEAIKIEDERAIFNRGNTKDQFEKWARRSFVKMGSVLAED